MDVVHTATAGESGLSANALRALRALKPAPPSTSRALTKSTLAVAVFGEDTASTRSMMTRLSAMLVRSGLAQERKDGRERFLSITAAGASELERHPEEDHSTKTFSGRYPELEDALATTRTHASDRPRFHLRHAALLALWTVRRQTAPKYMREDDMNFEHMLLSLACEQGTEKDNLQRDREVFDSLTPRWSKRDHRAWLVECLLRFQDYTSRRATGPDLVLLGEKIKPDSAAEVILWSSAAIEVAHHYSFAPASQVDRLTARRLLFRSKELLEHACRQHPELSTAVQYRLAKAAKVAGIGWRLDTQASSPKFVDAVDWQSIQLGQELDTLNTDVKQAAQFNVVLEGFDRDLAQYLGRWIILAFPSSEWVFRRAGGSDLPQAIQQWADEIRVRGALQEFLVPQVAAHPELQSKLQRFIERAKGFENSQFKAVIDPHVAQARALLGEDVSPNASETPYEKLLLNNLWNPEMVAADILRPHRQE